MIPGLDHLLPRQPILLHTEVGLNWLKVSLRAPLAEVQEYLRDLIGSDPAGWFKSPGGCYGYPDLWIHQGAYLFGGHSSGRTLVELRGGVLDRLPLTSVLEFVRYMLKPGHAAGVNRVDAFLDDFERRKTPDQIEKLDDLGRVSSPFRYLIGHDKKQRREHLKSKTKKTRNRMAKRIRTIKFGSNHSANCLVIYDKNEESNGARNCIRWEPRMSGSRGHSFLMDLLEAEDIRTVISAHVKWAFRAFGSRSKKKEAKWYRELIGDVERARIRKESKPEIDPELRMRTLMRRVSRDVGELIDHHLDGDPLLIHQLIDRRQSRSRSSRKARTGLASGGSSGAAHGPVQDLLLELQRRSVMAS